MKPATVMFLQAEMRRLKAAISALDLEIEAIEQKQRKVNYEAEALLKPFLEKRERALAHLADLTEDVGTDPAVFQPLPSVKTDT